MLILVMISVSLFLMPLSESRGTWASQLIPGRALAFPRPKASPPRVPSLPRQHPGLTPGKVFCSCRAV